MMKNKIIYSIICFLFSAALYSQDTLHYKGFLMSRLLPIFERDIYCSQFSNNGYVLKQQNKGGYHQENNRQGFASFNFNYFVQVDSMYNYDEGLAKGVFFMQSSSDNLEEVVTMKKALKRNPAHFLTNTEDFKFNNGFYVTDFYKSDFFINKIQKYPELYNNVTTYDYDEYLHTHTSIKIHFYLANNYWIDIMNYFFYINMYHFFYFTIPVEMEYIYVDEIEFETVNKDGNNAVDAFKKVKTSAFYITKIKKL